MNTKDKILVTALITVAVGLLITSCKTKPVKKLEEKETDQVFDTTELTSSYHFMHSEIKRK